MKKVFFLMGISAFFGVQSLPVSATGSSAESCHLSAGSSEILVDYSGTRIFSAYKPHSYSKGGVSIPAGKYDVYLDGFDGYEGRSSDAQSGEQYKVVLRSGGKVVATTKSSKDIKDGVQDAYWSGKVNSSLEVAHDVDNLQIVHANTGDRSASNSLNPTCMLLKPVDEPKKPVGAICGNGIVEGAEQCDDGNTTSGDQCSASCTYERNIIDPVCGNGIVEVGEQCDDGNADEKSCTSQCKVPEEDREKIEGCDAEIGNTVWNDRNQNGIQDVGEEGISDVKVKLQYGDKIKTDWTNYRGRYKFEDLCEDTYRVIVAIETLDNGCYQTYDKDGKLDHMYKKSLDHDEEFTKADFGYYCPGSGSHGKKSPDTGAGTLAGAASALFATAAAYLAYKRTRGKNKTVSFR